MMTPEKEQELLSETFCLTVSRGAATRLSLLIFLGVSCLIALPTFAQKSIAKWEVVVGESAALFDVRAPEAPLDLHNVDVLWRTEDLVEFPCFHLKGADSYVEIADRAALNPGALTLSVWFRLPEGLIFGQKPLVLKSALAHEGPTYQYGLFAANDADFPDTLAWYLSVGQTMHSVVAKSTPPRSWMR